MGGVVVDPPDPPPQPAVNIAKNKSNANAIGALSAARRVSSPFDIVPNNFAVP